VGTKGLVGDLESLSRPKEAISSTKGGRVVIAVWKEWEVAVRDRPAGVKTNFCYLWQLHALETAERGVARH
jgi:hypothetical protein